jgi:hypothetical protein
MSTVNVKIGSAIEPKADQETTPQAAVRCLSPGWGQDQGPLLAQFPDLDPKSLAKVPEKRPEARFLSQALSIKLVFGAGVVLIFAALLPFLPGKAKRSETTVTDLPVSWNHHESSFGNGTSDSQAPAWPSAVSVAPASPKSSPVSTPAILLPQAPQIGDTRGAGLTEPAWSQPRPAIAPVATAPSTSRSTLPNSPLANANSSDIPPGYRGSDRTGDSRALQADTRSDPSTQYRNYDSRYDGRGNELRTETARRDLPDGVNPRDPRYDIPPSRYATETPSSALMPSAMAGPAANYRDPQVPEPGVARFDGTISTPPVRTDYDRTGSGTH